MPTQSAVQYHLFFELNTGVSAYIFPDIPSGRSPFREYAVILLIAGENIIIPVFIKIADITGNEKNP